MRCRSTREDGGSSLAGFFGENVALGPELGDSLKVSFDFRVWRDASLNFLEQPEDAELRFGLYQDSDSQLGMTNNSAGRWETSGGFPPVLAPTPAVWGEEEGWFEGAQDDVSPGDPTDQVGSIGDFGFNSAVILEDKATLGHLGLPNGGDWRIREESNSPDPNLPVSDKRILQGSLDTDTVAIPQDPNNTGDYGLTNLDVTKVWHLSLELVRDEKFDDPNSAALPAITGNLSAYSLDDPNTVYTLSGTEFFTEPDPNQGNVQQSVDNFDYFALRVTGFDHYDIILDNFALEIEGSTATQSADFDGSGIVDGLDFLQWQRGDTPGGGSPEELALWEVQYGGPPPLSAVTAAVPEPSSILLFLLGLFGMRLKPCGLRSHRRE